MGDIIVDKNGNIRRGDRYYSTFYKTDKPRPEKIDPSTLSNPEGNNDAEYPRRKKKVLRKEKRTRDRLRKRKMRKIL